MAVILSWAQYVNSPPPGQNCRHFAHDISKCIFMKEKFCILIRISLKFVLKVIQNGVKPFINEIVKKSCFHVDL